MSIAEDIQTKDEHVQAEPAGARVVSLYPQITLARVVQSAGEEGWCVQVGRRRLVARVEESVDPALIERALESGARVVVEIDDEPRIVGTLQTRRAVEIDLDGDLTAKVRRFRVDATEEAMLRTPGAFVRLETHRVETYANQVLARGREVVRLLGAIIKLN